MTKQIVVEFWGPYACFAPPWARVDRVSMDMPTPSICRGMLSAIYSKPEEFYWQIDKIEMLQKPGYMNVKRNELKNKLSDRLNPIDTESVRTQRNTMLLTNVRYRVTAHMVLRSGFNKPPIALYEQAVRRIKKGQCYYQPSFGTREYVAFFELSDGTREPVDICEDFGIMPYDPWDFTSMNKEPRLSAFHCVMEGGTIIVPAYDSVDVIKTPVGKVGDVDAESAV